MQMNQITLAGPLLGVALATVGLTGLPVQDAQARPRYESCQSRHNNYQYCRTDTQGGVRLQQQLSKSACIQNLSWGYDRGGIWVKNGCRAEFVIGDAGGGYDRNGDSGYNRGREGEWNNGGGYHSDRGRDRDGEWNSSGSYHSDRGRDRDGERNSDGGYDREGERNKGGGWRLVCDAQGPGYRLCRADTRRGVRLTWQLSKTPCQQNQTWGYNRDGVWVNHGCRAEFEMR